tara:strand:- start:1280 stop:2590 length:1311 start_codon:yes stop_codon:yes gene_type:complete
MPRTRSRKQSYPSGLSNLLSTIKDKMLVGRVTDIILDKEHIYFDYQGGWSSIGTIFFEENNLQGSNNLTPARPFHPQNSSYPLVNELVLLFSLPNKKMGSNTSTETYYYINVISIWNSPHHNAYPNPILPNTEESAAKDYSQTDAGSPIRKTDDGALQPDGNSIELNSPTNDFQKTFIERNNISPLLPFPGDVIYEGRWGNSIRLGSTAKPPKTETVPPNFVNNLWSDPTETGKNGDPITIIRNGQSYDADNGWECVTEDIDLDQSSIYLTSHQKIPILSANTSYSSLLENEIPKPNIYEDPQVIITSDRLVFNSRTDSILMSSDKTMFIGSNNSVNVKANSKIILESEEIKLGKQSNPTDEFESMILGDTFLQELTQLVTGIIYISTSLQTSTIWPAGAPAPDATQSTPAGELLSRANKFLAKIETYKSTQSKLI